MNSSRKEAIRAYKERKPERGIFAIRCLPTADVWVESSPDLPAASNRIFFLLQLGDRFLEKSAVENFSAHGRDAFSFEILETLDEEINPLTVKDVLKERKLHWAAHLTAKKLTPA